MKNRGNPLAQVDLDFIYEELQQKWESLRNQHLLITGGTGFIGKWLVNALVDANQREQLGLKITILSRKPETFRLRFPWLANDPAVELLRGDLASLAFAKTSFHAIIHAGTDVAEPDAALATFDTCVYGTRRVLDLAAQSNCQRFLLLSSGAVYGRQPPQLLAIPESYSGSPNTGSASSAYGIGKLAAEWLTHTYAENHGFAAIVARCFAFVGPYLPLDKHFAIGNFIRDAQAGNPITIKGDGTPYRSYLYTADLAIWLLTLLLDGKGGETFNVGGDEPVTISELAQRVVTALGSESTIEIETPSVPGSIPSRYLPDITKAAVYHGLHPAISLDEAIRRTAQWHIDNGSQ